MFALLVLDVLVGWALVLASLLSLILLVLREGRQNRQDHHAFNEHGYPEK